jgi:dTDP-4-amino-4,6-dideoxygalactose transaminase
MASEEKFAVERMNFQFEFGTILPNVLSEIEAALVTGSYILTEPVERFERAFGAYVGAEFALGVNSGTDALNIALEALDIGRGDEVITVANTFHATALAIARTGAKPVLVDARSDDFLMDTEQIERAITRRTRAIIPVHLFGLPMDLTPVLDLCRRHSLYLLEDAAQATGASINERKVGAIGDIGCFSFHPSKNLAGAGDGGMVTTNRRDLAERIRSLRYFGQRERKVHSELGHNSKLDALQAIVLYHKLPFVDDWNEARKRHARALRSRLSEFPLTFQAPGPEGCHTYNLFQVRTSEREPLLSHLVERGIDAVVRYRVPIHLQEPFRTSEYTVGTFPVAESLARETLCLPIRPDLGADEAELMVDAVREFFSRPHR